MNKEMSITPSEEVAEGMELTGAEIVVRALKDQGVRHIFGYPGGAVLPIYDSLFQDNELVHVLVRHEQGAVHAAEGYAARRAGPAWGWSPAGPARPTRG